MRRFTLAVGLLALVRVAIPVLQLAHADLPGAPRIRGHALSGDAPGLYAGAREALAASGRVSPALLALLAAATIAVGVLLARAWRRRPELRAWLLLAGIWWLAILLAIDAGEQRFSGAGAAGWPLLWAIPMLPLRAAHALDPGSAFWAGLPLQLAANAVTVLATAFAGLYVTGRRSVGVTAGAAMAAWPLLTGAIAGHRAWENSTWRIDAGLHMYTEPISTALCAVALALVLSPRATPLRMVVAGACIGYAVTVKIPTALLAVAAALLVAWRLRREPTRLVAFGAAALAFAPLLAAYWHLGYSELSSRAGKSTADFWTTDFVVRNWTHSLLFTPRTLAILAPLALLGAIAVGARWKLSVLAVWTLVFPIFYSFFEFLAIHPRYVFASLPSFFVLWAAGADELVRLASRFTAAIVDRGRRPVREL